LRRYVYTLGLATGDVVLPSSLVTILTNGGAVAAGILAVVAIVMLALPLFGMKFCSLFGTCDIPPYQGIQNTSFTTSPFSSFKDVF
jgi:hypothetical protein